MAPWGPLRSLLALAPILICSPLFTYLQHKALPTPLTELTNSESLLPQISETNILSLVKELSEDIGFRTVGTYEHHLADEWMLRKANQVKAQCEELLKSSGRQLECEVWRQEGSGSHRFDLMNTRLYKTYVNLSNIIIRVSDGTPQGKEHAVLVNAHLDSTLPTPGAADDALGVAVMLDCLRVLVNTPDWKPTHAIIFLFNHAEESLQDGSQLYSTQHETAKTVRAAINLEAAGTRGREILFQATSEQMIDAYSYVPRPYGTIWANDVFSLNILQSDTDFRQFQKYLNITGLDMAVIGNGYLYHMRKDVVENIEHGVAQNMGENALALLRHLSSSKSPLASLTDGYTKPQTVFFSVLGYFFVYSFTTAKLLYVTLLFASYALTRVQLNVRYNSIVSSVGRAVLANVFGFFSALVAPNIVALIMSKVLGRGLSWYSREWLPIVLYGPPAILGALVSQWIIMRNGKPLTEASLFAATLLLQCHITTALQFCGIGSAAVLFMTSVPLFAVFALNPVFLATFSPALSSEARKPVPRSAALREAERQARKAEIDAYVKGPRPPLVDLTHEGHVSLWTYGLGQIFPLVLWTTIAMPTLDVFVPLMGRVGADVPSDNAIATIIAAMGTIALPLVIPFAHRLGQADLKRAIYIMTLITTILMAVFAQRQPFDDMHQKRVFGLRLENVTSGEHHFHMSHADGAPNFEAIVQGVADKFANGRAQLEAVTMNDHNADWDILYPFSIALSPYKVPLTVPPGYVSPWHPKSNSKRKFEVTAIKDSKNIAEGTRSLTLKIDHPGLIWTVIAFDAHVLDWDLDDSPPEEYTRHHIKEASAYGTDSYTISMILKLDAAHNDQLSINFIGVQEKAMWPGKRAVSRPSINEEGGLALAFFEEIDAWLKKTTEDRVDATLLAASAGVVVI